MSEPGSNGSPNQRSVAHGDEPERLHQHCQHQHRHPAHQDKAHEPADQEFEVAQWARVQHLGHPLSGVARAQVEGEEDHPQ